MLLCPIGGFPFMLGTDIWQRDSIMVALVASFGHPPAIAVCCCESNSLEMLSKS